MPRSRAKYTVTRTYRCVARLKCRYRRETVKVNDARWFNAIHADASLVLRELVKERPFGDSVCFIFITVYARAIRSPLSAGGGLRFCWSCLETLEIRIISLRIRCHRLSIQGDANYFRNTILKKNKQTRCQISPTKLQIPHQFSTKRPVEPTHINLSRNRNARLRFTRNK